MASIKTFQNLELNSVLWKINSFWNLKSSSEKRLKPLITKKSKLFTNNWHSN